MTFRTTIRGVWAEASPFTKFLENQRERKMVREWKGEIDWDGVGGSIIIAMWGILVIFCLISAIIFSCADGASRDKAAAADSTATYAGGCAADCGAACGG